MDRKPGASEMEGSGMNRTAQDGTQALFNTDFDLPTVHDWPFPSLSVESSHQENGDASSSSLTTLTDSSEFGRPNAVDLLARGETLSNSPTHTRAVSTGQPNLNMPSISLPLRSPTSTGRIKVGSVGEQRHSLGDPVISRKSNDNQREEEDEDDDSEYHSEDSVLQVQASKGASGQKWSSADDRLLIDLIEQGASVVEACKPFPQRTVQGVCQHVKKLKERGLIIVDISAEIKRHSSKLLYLKQQKPKNSPVSMGSIGELREKNPKAWSKEEEEILIKGHLAGVPHPELLLRLPRRSTVKSLQNHLSKLKARGRPELQHQAATRKRTFSTAFLESQGGDPVSQQSARPITKPIKRTSDSPFLSTIASTAGPGSAVTANDIVYSTALQRYRRERTAVIATTSATTPFMNTVAAPTIDMGDLPDNAEFEQHLLKLEKTRKRMEKTLDLANKIRDEQDKIDEIKADIVRALGG